MASSWAPEVGVEVLRLQLGLRGACTARVQAPGWSVALAICLGSVRAAELLCSLGNF